MTPDGPLPVTEADANAARSFLTRWISHWSEDDVAELTKDFARHRLAAPPPEAEGKGLSDGAIYQMVSERGATPPDLRAVLRMVWEDIQIAQETWVDSATGPATVAGEGRELKELSAETVSAVADAISFSAPPEADTIAKLRDRVNSLEAGFQEIILGEAYTSRARRIARQALATLPPENTDA